MTAELAHIGASVLRYSEERIEIALLIHQLVKGALLGYLAFFQREDACTAAEDILVRSWVTMTRVQPSGSGIAPGTSNELFASGKAVGLIR